MKIRQHISTKLITAALLICLTTLTPAVLAAPSPLPPGIYSVSITLADIPPEFPPEVADILVGTWTTEFTSAGTTLISQNGEVVVSGRYTSSKTHLVITDLDGPMACVDGRGIATGVYTWSIVNSELHFTTVLDRCFGRMFVLTLRGLQQL